jgi:hypothetical protein
MNQTWLVLELFPERYPLFIGLWAMILQLFEKSDCTEYEWSGNIDAFSLSTSRRERVFPQVPSPL